MLALLITLPAALLWFVSYTRKYNNTDHKWMRGYIIAVTANTVAYLLVIANDALAVRSLYYIVSVSSSAYIFYQELFVRIIRKGEDAAQELAPAASEIVEAKAAYSAKNGHREAALFDTIEKYMSKKQAWRNPNISMLALVKRLETNRRSLLLTLQKHGFDGYPSYINSKRVADFIQLITSGEINTYQDAFFEVGFRSRATALRNFKEVTGTTPSEYFSGKK